jgi:hypothetical protein
VTLLFLSQLLAGLALVFAILAFSLRWRAAMRRPLALDRAPAKGEVREGVAYAFSWGMMPWAKESTRRHLPAYLRGIAFHLGIFAGLLALLLSPFWTRLPSFALAALALLAGLGALFGAAGIAMRLLETNLRTISTLDDHASVLLVSTFLASASAALVRPEWTPAMYLAGAVMLFYAPLGKIRHCIYFFLSRLFFGTFIGRRAVLHPPRPHAGPATIWGEGVRR